MNTEQLEQLAEKTAIEKGYYQSDKEHIETTPWSQHNIYVKGFTSGYQLASLRTKELEEEVEYLKGKKRNVAALARANINWQRKKRKELEDRVKELRNELYEAIPVGHVDTWDLLKVINNHIKKLDNISNHKTKA